MGQRWKEAFVTGICAPALLLAAAVALPMPASAQSIQACVTKPRGVLVIPERAGECRKGDQTLTWNEIGPIGPSGPAGPVGAAGSIFRTGTEQSVDVATQPRTRIRVSFASTEHNPAQLLANQFGAESSFLFSRPSDM